MSHATLLAVSLRLCNPICSLDAVIAVARKISQVHGVCVLLSCALNSVRTMEFVHTYNCILQYVI